MSNKIHYVSSAAAQPDDTILDLVGRLESVKVKTDKNDKTFYNIKLSGGGTALYGNVWVKYTPEPLIGQTVIVRGAKMGTFNGNRSFSMQRGSVEEFREDLDAAPQQAHQEASSFAPQLAGRSISPPAHQNAPRATGTARLSEYAALYSACLAEAAQVVSRVNPALDQDPDALRNIASCLFIQAIKDGVKVEGGNVPF